MASSELPLPDALDWDPAAPAPRVSIVVPTFNSEAYLTSTVDSVRHQTLVNWQLVLSDDGSTDATLDLTDALVASDRRIISVKGMHAGPVATRMRGLSCSDPRSEFVIFLDHDDTWEPDALAVLVDALQKHPECVAAYGLARGTNMAGQPFEDDDLAESMRRRTVLRGGRFVDLEAGSRTPFEAMLLKNCPTSFGTTLIRRAALTALGGLDASTAPADDWDLFIRLSRLSDLYLVDHIILNWRRHPGALSNTSKRWKWSYLIVRARTIGYHRNSAQHRRAAVDALLTDNRRWRGEMVASLRHGGVRQASRAVAFVAITYAMYVRFQWFTGGRAPLGAVSPAPHANG
jgi:glycosyltransferase involved in cell wall biosynthesis